MKIAKILIAIFLTLGIFSNTVNAQEKNFGIKGFNLNSEYVEPKNCDRVTYQSNVFQGEYTHRNCKQETTVMEELFDVDYKLLDDKVYEAKFELKIVATYVESFLPCLQNKVCVEDFIRTGRWPENSYLPKFKTDYSKFSNLIIEKINELIGGFNSNKKSKETTPLVSEILQNNDVRKTIENINSREVRRQLVAGVGKQPESKVLSTALGVHMYTMLTQCYPNCNVDKYRFEWKRKDLNVFVEVFVPEKKNAIALNYQVNIYYVNPDVKKKVQLLKDELEQKISLELENQNRLNRAREEEKMLIEKKLKQEEINKRKQDF